MALVDGGYYGASVLANLCSYRCRLLHLHRGQGATVNRAARFCVYLASVAALGILSQIAQISYWLYFPMMGVVLILGMSYIGEEE